MNHVLRNKLGKYLNFYLVIMGTSLLKDIQKGKKEKKIGTECNQHFTIRFFDESVGFKMSVEA